MSKRLTSFMALVAIMVGISGNVVAQESADGHVLPRFSGTPQFCFLEFPSSTDQHAEVLIALDGNKLYFDRNANGDLTEDGEAVESVADKTRMSERDLQFEIDEIKVGDRVHNSVKMTVAPLENYSRGEPEFAAILKENPAANACMIYAEIQDDRFRGKGLDGRVIVSAGFSDMEGVLQFGDTIDDAPTIRFCGTLEIRPYQKTRLRPGATKDIVLVVGSSGMGPGTFASIGYEGVIPETAYPRMMLETKIAESNKTEITSQELKRRC